MKRSVLLKLHRWLGLFAATWLLTLGLTGIFLDHDEWRWLRQTEVPENWFIFRISKNNKTDDSRTTFIFF